MQSQKFELNFDPEARRLARRSSLKRSFTASIAAIGVVMTEATVLSVQAASLTQWNFDPAVNQLEITVKDGTTPRYFLMAQPARIVLDLPGTAVGSVSAQQTYEGAVRQIRVSQFEPGLTRIVMEISPGVSLAPGQVKLQKVGEGAPASGNSRWVLQPLITKSLSANAVTIQPPTPSPSRPTVTRPTVANSPASTPAARAPKPLETTPSIAPSAPSKLPRPNPSSAPSQVVTSGNNVSSQPAVANIPATPSRPTRESESDRKPTVVVPDLTGAKTPAATPSASPSSAVELPQSAALAPVLPSPSSAAVPTGTPPPPASTLTDPNVAIDTQSGVAIAVPMPSSPSTISGVSPQPPVPDSPPITPQPQRLAQVEPLSEARLSATARPIATPTPAIASRPIAPPIVQLSAPASIAAPEIPGTLAAAPTVSPSVSVPPLNASTAATGASTPSTAQTRNPPVRQPEASFDMPSAGLSATGTQPSVSVPPPIQVGTPSLGPVNSAPSAIEAAPISVFAPNAPIEPPVSVPPLQQPAPLQQPDTAATVPIKPAQASYDATTIRQSTSSADLAPPLNVVPLQASVQQPTAPLPTTPGYDANTIRQASPDAKPTPVVEFGQPLPAKDSTVKPSQPLNGLTTSQGVRQAFKPTAPDVLLPAGTVLNLRYPGDATLLLQTDRPQQEVLVLLTELRDAAGNLLAPAGSAVTGRFETTTGGSQFVTQAIAVSGRTIPLSAQSDTLDGSRKVQGNNLAVNSGIGLVAGGVLGAVGGSAGLGALGGAAAGAAATLLTAPKPAAIQPGQVVQVRLTQDLRSFE